MKALEMAAYRSYRRISGIMYKGLTVDSEVAEFLGDATPTGTDTLVEDVGDLT